MRTVFVTGAEGFAGTHLTELLRKKGVEVVAGVRNRGRKLAIERRSGKAVVCDVADAINVARAVASVKPDTVAHLAGPSEPAAAAAEPLEAYQSIVTGWANILDAVRRCVPRARVLMVSAADVYGNAGTDGRALDENAPVQPVTTFGDLKATAESIAHAFFRNYHLNVTIARPFAYTGPGQPENSFLGSIARRIASRNNNGSCNDLQVPNLDCRRDVVHVQDLAEAYALLLADGKPNEIYNVCSGTAVAWRDLVQAIARACGCPNGVHLPDAVGGQPPLPCLRGDNRKLSQLGWKPTHDVTQALTDLVRTCEAGSKAKHAATEPALA